MASALRSSLNWSLVFALLRTFSLARASPLIPIATVAGEGEGASSGSELWFDLGAAVVLVLVGGVFAGLTIAYVKCEMIKGYWLTISED